MTQEVRTEAEKELFMRYLRRPSRRRLTVVVRAFYRHVWNVARRITGNQEDAADVSQEVFLSLILKPPAPEKIRSPRGYLSYRVLALAERLGRAARRRRKRENDVARRVALSVADSEIDVEAVGQAIRALPDRTKAIIELRYFAGYSTSEIGKLLQISERTVVAEQRRGRELLRKRLGQGVISLLPLLVPMVPAEAAPPAGFLSGLLQLVNYGGALSAPSAASIIGGTTMAASKMKLALSALMLILVILLGSYAGISLVKEESTHSEKTVHVALDPTEAPGEKLQSPEQESSRETTDSTSKPIFALSVVNAQGAIIRDSAVQMRWRQRFEGEELLRVLPEISWLERAPRGDFLCHVREGSVADLLVTAPAYLPLRESLEIPEGGLAETVRLTLKRGSALSGRLVDAMQMDAPVANARVGTVQARKTSGAPKGIFDYSLAPALYTEAKSDEEGRFSLTGVRGHVWVLAEGYGPTVLRDVRSHALENREYSIPIYPPTHLHIVAEEDTGVPVTNFEYRIDDYAYWDFEWKGRDVDGNTATHLLYHVYDLGTDFAPLDIVTLGIRFPNHLVVVRKVKIAYGQENSVNVRAKSLSAVCGVVQSPNGEPLPGVYLRKLGNGRVNNLSAVLKRGAIEPHDGVISRQDGFFRLPLPAGTHRLLVYHPDYLHYASHPLEIYAHQETQYDFRLPAPARIAGWISEGLGPRVDRTVTLGPTVSLVKVRLNTETDGEGRFCFDKVPPGVYRMSLSDAPGNFVPPVLSIKADGNYEVTLGESELSDGVQVVGRVTENGEPLPGVTVQIGPSGRTETNLAGEFQVDGVPAGSQTIWVHRGMLGKGPRKRFHMPLKLTVDVELGMAPLTFDFFAGSVEGRVLSSGQGVPGAQFQLWSKDPNGGSWQKQFFKDRSDLNGGYRIDGLLGKQHVLIVSREGYRTQVESIDLNTPGDSVQHDVLLTPSGEADAVHLRIVDARSGLPLAAMVSLRRTAVPGNPVFASGTKSEEDDVCTFADLPSGCYQALINTARNAHVSEVVSFEKKEGEAAELEVRMRSAGLLSTRIVTPSGRLPQFPTIEIFTPDGEEVNLAVDLWTPSASRSRVRSSLRLPPGRFSIRAKAQGYKPTEMAVQIEEAKCTHVVVELTE